MSGDSNITNKAPKAASIRAMTSAYGRRIPLVYGRARVQANVIYYTDFVATENKTKTKSGGKGGGGVTQTNISYTYEVCSLFALCEGSVTEISTVWVGKQKGSLADFGLSSFLGTNSQSALGYISTNHPTEAIPYRNTAYIGASKFFLGDDPSIPNINAEVRGRLANIDINGTGQWDANPANVILDLITDPKACLGLSIPTSGLTDNVKTYCQALGVYVSPAYTEAKPARDMIKSLCDISNTAVYFSEGIVKFVPLYDKTATSGAITFTPNLTPVYAITTNDILDDGAINVIRKAQDDCYNMVNVNYQNRAIEYNDDVQPAFDQSSIEVNGPRPMADLNYPEIVNSEVAKLVGQQAIQRSNAIKATYEFKLGWQYSRLEPTDIITITDPSLGLNAKGVRILQIDEDDNGLYIKAEELLAGALAPARYTTQESDGYLVDYNRNPGNTNTPYIFDAPIQIAGGPEVWVALSGGSSDWGGCNIWVSEDDVTYKLVGQQSGPARHGTLTATLPGTFTGFPGSTIDQTNTLAVSILANGQTLDDATTTAALDNETLMIVDGEIMSYRDSTLTGTNAYSLNYLPRGQYGSSVAAHSSGTKWARLDGMIFKYKYDPDTYLNRTMYFKFQSFNVYGSAYQDISILPAYTHFLAGFALPPVSGLSLVQTFNGDSAKVKWDPVRGATKYEVQVRNLAGTTTYRTSQTENINYEYTWRDGKTDGGPYRDLRFYVKAISDTGESAFSFINAQNAVPATVAGLSIVGGFGIINGKWNPSPETDIMGYQIWMSTTSGFTPGAGNLLLDTKTNEFSTRVTPAGSAIVGGTTYYFRVAAYDNFGTTGLNISSEISATVLTITGGIGPGEITGAMIQDGTIAMTEFASSIRPPRVVTTLPTIDGTTYKNQDTVLLTTDGKLYRAVSGSWTAVVPAADVTGQLTDAQLAAIAAAKVTGQLTNSQIADLAAAKISGQLTDAQIAAIAAAKVTGTLTNSQIADLAAAKITGTLTNSQIADLDAAKITGQIVSTQITDGAISSPKIAAGAVVAGKIAANAVTATEISAGSITTAKIAANAVTATEILAGSITTAKIATGAVTATEIAAGAVVAGKIAANAVTATEISAGSITTAKIAANAVTASEISAGAITTAKIAASAVTASEIAAGAVVAGKIAANAITATEIAAGAVTTAKLAAGSVTANEIAANTITAGKIATGTITATQIAAAGITGDRLAANTITGDKIAANTITAGNIAANTITASQIAANTITTDRIVVGAASAASAYLTTHTTTTPASATSWTRTDTLGNFTSTGVDANVFITGNVIAGDPSGFGVSLGSTVTKVRVRVEPVIAGVVKSSAVNLSNHPVILVGSNRSCHLPVSVVWRGAMSAGSVSIGLKTTVEFFTDTGTVSTTGSFVVSTSGIVIENKV